MSVFDNSDEKADARMDQIFETMKSEDKEALKAMFSKQAMTDADNFARGLDALFEYIQGDVQSWERTGTYGGKNEKNVDGSHKKEVDSTYVFSTDEHKYEIAVYEFTIDTANPDNVGVYSICVINKNDKLNPEARYWGNGEAGINIGNS